jgi:drug/metabolite transporter (DMT)-like permease
MRVYIKLLSTAFFWGGTFIAGRVIAGRVMPFSAAFMRFAIASALLLTILRHREGRFPRPGRRTLAGVVALGLTGALAYNVFFFSGLARIAAGRASLIIATNPIVIAVFAAVIFKERLTGLKCIGILLSVTGAIIVISKGDPAFIFNGGIGAGELFIFGCVLSWAAYSLIGKYVMRDLSPLAAVALSSAAGAALLLLPALNEGMMAHLSAYRWQDWTSLAYLGVFGTVIGFVWYYDAIRIIGPSRASLFINFVPISAIVLAYVVLAEPVTPSLAAGAVFVACGVYLTNRQHARRAPTAAITSAKSTGC